MSAMGSYKGNLIMTHILCALRIVWRFIMATNSLTMVNTIKVVQFLHHFIILLHIVWQCAKTMSSFILMAHFSVQTAKCQRSTLCTVYLIWIQDSRNNFQNIYFTFKVVILIVMTSYSIMSTKLFALLIVLRIWFRTLICHHV